MPKKPILLNKNTVEYQKARPSRIKIEILVNFAAFKTVSQVVKAKAIEAIIIELISDGGMPPLIKFCPGDQKNKLARTANKPSPLIMKLNIISIVANL